MRTVTARSWRRLRHHLAGQRAEAGEADAAASARRRDGARTVRVEEGGAETSRSRLTVKRPPPAPLPHQGPGPARASRRSSRWRSSTSPACPRSCCRPTCTWRGSIWPARVSDERHRGRSRSQIDALAPRPVEVQALRGLDGDLAAQLEHDRLRANGRLEGIAGAKLALRANLAESRSMPPDLAPVRSLRSHRRSARSHQGSRPDSAASDLSRQAFGDGHAPRHRAGDFGELRAGGARGQRLRLEDISRDRPARAAHRRRGQGESRSESFAREEQPRPRSARSSPFDLTREPAQACNSSSRTRSTRPGAGEAADHFPGCRWKSWRPQACCRTNLPARYRAQLELSGTEAQPQLSLTASGKQLSIGALHQSRRRAALERSAEIPPRHRVENQAARPTRSSRSMCRLPPPRGVGGGGAKRIRAREPLTPLLINCTLALQVQTEKLVLGRLSQNNLASGQSASVTTASSSRKRSAARMSTPQCAGAEGQPHLARHRRGGSRIGRCRGLFRGEQRWRDGPPRSCAAERTGAARGPCPAGKRTDCQISARQRARPLLLKQSRLR